MESVTNRVIANLVKAALMPVLSGQSGFKNVANESDNGPKQLEAGYLSKID